MHIKQTLLFIALCTFSLMSFAQDDQDIKAYIEKFKGLAIEEQMRSGVPAAITLAQGIYESDAGRSVLAIEGNNHFGIKCKSTWIGETILHDDDKKQECFRKYPSAEQSYIDHSDFLKGSNRYHFLFDLEMTDAMGWASGLKRAGYATRPDYVSRLYNLVEKYNLQQYTYEALGRSIPVVGEVVPNTDAFSNLKNVSDPSTFYKGIKGFWAKKGDILLDKAIENNIRYAKLLSLNDLDDKPLETDMFIFTEKKRKVGTVEFHIVKANESMLLIAQKEAILLDNLYLFNNMIPGQEPEVNEQLTLQYRAYGAPKLKQKFLATIPREIKKEEPKIEVVKVEKKEEPIPATIPTPIPTPIQKEIVKEQTEPTPVLVVKKEIPVEMDTVKIESAQETVTAKSTIDATPIQTEVKQDPPPIEVEKKQEAIIEPVKMEVKVDTNNEAILDAEKAKRMEALLNSSSLVKIQQPVIVKDTAALDKGEKLVSITYGSAPKAVEPKAVEPLPVKVSNERRYDEPNVSDTVKQLKRRFDPIIYKALPARKKVEPNPKASIETTPNNATKPDAKKGTESKKALAEKEAKRLAEEKKNDVKKTQTGIVRNAKKIAAQKELEEREAKKGRNADRNKKKNKGEAESKKAKGKEVNDKAKKEKNKKKEPVAKKKNKK